MIITTARRLSLSSLLLACSFVVSCNNEQSTQTKATAAKQVEQESPVTVENTVVASEDEVLTWDESASKTKSDSEKTNSDK
jgi:hypothetical protein